MVVRGNNKGEMMEKKNLKRYYMLGTVIIGLMIIAGISYIYLFNKVSHPFDAVRKTRTDIVETHELIDMEKTEKGVMLYWVGKANHGADNMYFVDMVEKSFIGYQWAGGGGHINHDFDRRTPFVFSVQLLNEEQNVSPTLFGVFSDKRIEKLAVRTQGNKSYNAIIYDLKSGEEQFYYIPLIDDVADYKYFVFTITYEDNETVKYIVSDDNISEFQKGKQLYFY